MTEKGMNESVLFVGDLNHTGLSAQKPFPDLSGDHKILGTKPKIWSAKTNPAIGHIPGPTNGMKCVFQTL